MKGISAAVVVALMLLITVVLAYFAHMAITKILETIDEKCGRLFEYRNITEGNVISWWKVNNKCNCEFCNRTHVFEDFYQESCWVKEYKWR